MSIAKSKTELSQEDLISKCDNIMSQYWEANPDLFEAVQKKKHIIELLTAENHVNDLFQPPTPKALYPEKNKPYNDRANAQCT